MNKPFKFSELAFVSVRRVILAGALSCLLVVCSFAARRERLIESWKPLNYNISLKLDERLSQVTNAKAEITIQVLKDNLSTIDLDFGEMSVDSVSVDSQATTFEHGNGRLNVSLQKPQPRGARILVTVTYHGVPKDGLILSKDKSGRPSAIGDNWPDRVHHWIPTLDHPSAKATVNFSVTAPEHALVVANGALGQVTTASAGTRTWTYSERSPVPPYCMVIAVGEFALLKPDGPTVTPLSYYVPPPDRELAIKGFATANPSLKFFSETIAPYPYDKLALIVGATRFGGMENSSAIVFNNNLFNARTSSEAVSRVFNLRFGLVSLVGHEIAHQWFGDSVTESTWADLWLSEGFATYFSALFVERHEGEVAFKQQMQKAAETYFAYAKNTRTPLFDTETENLMRLLNPNNYQKGAWVLHMLRRRLGDEDFFKGLRAFYRAHEHGTASSEDLRSALEKASGASLKEFFARWVYGSGHPEYQVSWRWQRVKNRVGTLTIELKQTQPEAPFPDPLEIEIVTAKGSQKTRVTPSGRDSVFQLAASVRPKEVRIDPRESILKEMVVN
ncbi:MAG TPA: M1 family metallopeptidase [Pyrinomonadaceae bacterium]|nr:M1 family metallopeptidase [Pyrinomonadaceae bacterium]